MCFGAISVGALIVAVAMFAMINSSTPSPNAGNAASSAEPNSAGTIVMHSGLSGCQQRSFDNRTGQISDQPSTCRNEMVLDARGLPVPTGTIHTLNSISKSFK
jgi:hypothetical protein